MVNVALYLDRNEDKIVKKYQKKWKKEGMDGTNKNEVIKRIIREYGKLK